MRGFLKLMDSRRTRGRMRSPSATRPVIYFFEDNATLAGKTASILHARCLKIRDRQFPDGESLVQVDETAPPEAIVIHSLDHPDVKLMPTRLAADALRRAGARN